MRTCVAGHDATEGPDPLVLAAVSGGADSLALAHALLHEGGPTRTGVVVVDHDLQPGSAEVAARAAEQCRAMRTPDGRAEYVHFQGGSVYASPATGAHAVRGAVRDRWRDTGWETGPLGLPTTDETSVATGSVQDFERGAVYASAGTGAHRVPAPVRDALRAAGGPERWGFPVEEPQPESGGQVRQRFARGAPVEKLQATRRSPTFSRVIWSSSE